MSNLIRLNPTRWPYSLVQLRLDEPTRSFSSSPSASELSWFDVFPVVEQPQPEHEPGEYRVVEVSPILIDGQWIQQWDLVELSDREKMDYWSRQNPPQWIAFSEDLPSEVDALLNAAQNVSPRLALALGVGLSKASDGDIRVFLNAWQTCYELGLISDELMKTIQDLSVQHHLPPEFVDGLVLIQQ